MAPSSNGHAPEVVKHRKAGIENDRSSSARLASISNTYRCRHLQAISLRNLVLSSSQERDDEQTVLPTELSQILSDEEPVSTDDEARNVESEPLTPSSEGTEQPSPTDAAPQPISRQKVRQNGAARPPLSKHRPKRRPSAKRQISRSMSTAFAEARQRAYEDRILSRRIVTFFSVHRIGSDCQIEDEPIYVSEVQARSMNPDFRPFAHGEIEDQLFLRSRRLVIRIWGRTVEDRSYCLLVEEAVVLPELHFVAKDLDYAEGDFRDNTVLFHFPDGIYASYSSPRFERRSDAARSNVAETRTASFDTLMKLKTLVDVIDDATETQQRLAEQIEAILKDTGGRQATEQNASAQDSLQTVRDGVARVGRDISRLKHEREQKKKRAQSRQHEYSQARTKLSHSSSSSSKLKQEAVLIKQQQAALRESLSSHSARIAEDLLTIFPIEPMPSDPLSFTIRGCHCPHAKVYERTHPPPNEPEVSAALGFVATVVTSLSRTLLLHVPYTIHALGSNSTVRDDITASSELEFNKLVPPGTANDASGEDGARTFPLYAKGADPARFRYAVYLLNRDIEELVTKQGLRVVDVRDTLANIGFLLNSIAGTTRHLPRREAGKVAAFRVEQ